MYTNTIYMFQLIVNSKKKHKRLNLSSETTYETQVNHIYEGMIYNNPTFDTLPPPPTEEELNIALNNVRPYRLVTISNLL